MDNTDSMGKNFLPSAREQEREIKGQMRVVLRTVSSLAFVHCVERKKLVERRERGEKK